MTTTLSLAHLTVLTASPVELIELAATTGFDAVGLRLWPPLPGVTVAPVVEDEALQRAIRRKLRDTGIELFDIEAFWLRADSDPAAFRRAFEVGASLGARHLLLVGHDPDRARLVDSFARACEDAAACGLLPMLEFIPYSAIRTLQEAHALILASGAGTAGLLVDALHLARSGGSPADLAAYPADLFRYLHLCDAPATPPVGTEQLRAEARGARLLPGEGELWLADLVKSVPAGTPVALEAPMPPDAGLPTIERLRHAAKLTRSVIKRAHCRAAR
jgi:sugar phosphate isomerase/epimerase